MTNQIIFPAEYGRERGRITSSVQDSPSTYTIYARRRNGDYMDITGAAIDAKFELISTGTVYDSTGTFTIVSGSGGCFTWLPSSADLGLAGDFYLQFTIDGERSEDDLTWEIQARLDSDGSTPPTAMTSLTAAQITLVQTLATLSGLANFNGSGSAGAILIKLNATAAPTVNDDSGDGYTIGSIWIDTTNDNAYIATDVTVGAANWEQINGSGGGAVDSVFGRTGAVVAVDDDYALSQIADDSALAKSSAAAAVNTLATSVEGLETVTQAHYNATTSVHGIADTSALLTTGAIGSTVQAYSAKTAAIAALTWAANSIVLLTGTATASVQALAAHIVTLLQSASAADARTAIGAGTGDGDVTAAAAFATDNRAIRADGTGKGVQYSTIILDDNGGLTLGPGSASTTSRVITFIGSTGTTLGYIDVAAGILRFVGVTNTAIFADNAEVVRIANTSRVGIGRTSPEGKLHVYDSGGGFMQCYKSGVVGSATAVLPDAAGDVTLCLSGTFTISDGAGNTAGGVITKTAPGGTFNLYDDGGTNTCQLQISAGGAVTVIRTAGSRTYAVNLQLNWM